MRRSVIVHAELTMFGVPVIDSLDLALDFVLDLWQDLSTDVAQEERSLSHPHQHPDRCGRECSHVLH